MNDFLKNIKNKFVTNNHVTIKVGFTIENIQPSPEEIGTSITNSGYWSTQPYRTCYFNDHVFFSLKVNKEKRVEANGMSGSSWQFRRFLHLNLSVLEQEGSITALGMDFIDFEADVGSIDDKKKEDFNFISSDDDSSFNDASDILESVYESYTFQNVQVNIDNVFKKST